jgi:hypothetical protein
VQQRRFLGFTREERLDQFQIADGGGVENERVGAIIERWPLQMVEGSPLRIAEIMQDGGGSPGCQRPGFQAASVERE